MTSTFRDKLSCVPCQTLVRYPYSSICSIYHSLRILKIPSDRLIETVEKQMTEFRYKQVIVFRSDLKLSKGKAAVQAGHAAVSAAEEARKHRKSWWQAWMDEGQRKIAVKVKSETELLALEKEAKKLELPCTLIVDRGLTEIPPNTITCLGIGPAPAERVGNITDKLPLL
jgi:PTH2 family peptidyl-tRNA hydrolase